MYVCKACGAHFRDSPISSVKGNNTGLFVIALDLYAKKVSTRDISDHLFQVYGVKKAPSTIHFWVQRFERLAVSVSKKERLMVGDRWLADEMVVRVRGRRMYLWNILDHKTRQLIASLLTKGRGTPEARRAITEAIRRAGKDPKVLVTDALGSYGSGLQAMHKPGIKHLARTALGRKEGNQRIERFHSTVRAWEKAHKRTGNKKGAQFEGFRMYYNRIRPHSALGGATPTSEWEGLNNERPRWATILKKPTGTRGHAQEHRTHA
jgi:transposase-like protein